MRVLKAAQRVVPPLFVLILAVLGSLQIKPFGINYSDSQLIAAMLAILAIDAFVDRFSVLRTIESKVDHIHRRANMSDGDGIRFIQRLEQEKLPEIIRSARRRLWISGPSLDSIVQCRDEIRAQIRNGVEVRILMIDPTVELIEWYGKHVVGPTYSLIDDLGRARAKERLEGNREALMELASANPRKFSMRVLERMMWLGYVIVDAGEEGHRMDVQLYMYKTSADVAPILQFGPTSNRNWYRVMFEQYELYWTEARDILKQTQK